MATKAKKSGKAAKLRRDVPVDTSKPGVSATDRKAGQGSTASRNRSLHAARKAGAVLEDSAGIPSRKSSRRSRGKVETTSYNEQGVESKRKGEGRTKRDANLQLRTVARTRAPSTRTQRKIGGGSGKKP